MCNQLVGTRQIVHGHLHRLNQPSRLNHPEQNMRKGNATADAILKFGADGNLDLVQFESVFGIELGSTVELKAKTSSGDNIVYHVG